MSELASAPAVDHGVKRATVDIEFHDGTRCRVEFDPDSLAGESLVRLSAPVREVESSPEGWVSREFTGERTATVSLSGPATWAQIPPDSDGVG